MNLKAGKQTVEILQLADPDLIILKILTESLIMKAWNLAS